MDWALPMACWICIMFIPFPFITTARSRASCPVFIIGTVRPGRAFTRAWIVGAPSGSGVDRLRKPPPSKSLRIRVVWFAH